MTEWNREESEAMRILASALEDHLELSSQAKALVPRAVDALNACSSGPWPLAVQVQLRLINRLLTELRVVELCTERSYVLQALSVGANMFELAHAVGYIGSDYARAQAWLAHTGSRKSYPDRVKDAVIESLRVQARPNSGVEDEMKFYEFLCMAKHGNPTRVRLEVEEWQLVAC